MLALAVQGMAFLGLGLQFLEHHRLLSINQAFFGPVRPSLEIVQSVPRSLVFLEIDHSVLRCV